MDAAEQEARRRRRRLTLLLTPIVALVIANNVGAALAPTLANDAPLLLIALNSQNRHLVLVSNELDALSFYGVALARLLLSDPLFFLIGRWYGDAAISWVEKRSSSTGGMLRTAERWFGRAGPALVFVMPNNYVCLFAGASRMPVPLFFVVNVAGTLTRLALLRLVGDVFESPLDSVLDFLGRYRWQTTAVTVALVALQLWGDRRKGRGELESVGELEREITEEQSGRPGDPV